MLSISSLYRGFPHPGTVTPQYCRIDRVHLSGNFRKCSIQRDVTRLARRLNEPR
ncbi:hypothetical protein WN48_10091 [Eufriesea mexicana]|nr:hypothetical protein WN48_10091 [Eufriesea mexicana]